MHTEEPKSEVKALAAAEGRLEAMMRRIISEFKSKLTELKRSKSQLERDAYKRGRQEVQGEGRIFPRYLVTVWRYLFARYLFAQQLFTQPHDCFWLSMKND